MDFKKCVLYRVIYAAPVAIQSLFSFCLLKFVICQGKKTLLIRSPNSFTADRINENMTGIMGKKVLNLGIDRYLIDDGEGILSLYLFKGKSFTFIRDSSAARLEDLGILPDGEVPF